MWPHWLTGHKTFKLLPGISGSPPILLFLVNMHCFIISWFQFMYNWGTLTWNKSSEGSSVVGVCVCEREREFYVVRYSWHKLTSQLLSHSRVQGYLLVCCVQSCCIQSGRLGYKGTCQAQLLYPARMTLVYKGTCQAQLLYPVRTTRVQRNLSSTAVVSSQDD